MFVILRQNLLNTSKISLWAKICRFDGTEQDTEPPPTHPTMAAVLYYPFVFKRGPFAVPNIKSAIKRVKVAERNRLRNKAWRSSIRTVKNKVVETLNSPKPEKAAEALQNAYSVIDRAVSKGVLHKNAAARRKSRLAKRILEQTASAR
jgi:small subunit ribosomal protein S20